MKILQYSIDNPIKVIVGVLFVILFGAQAFLTMPYQLSPLVEYPTITVRTTWTGSTPYDIEREIIKEQEDVLKSLSGLREMESTASNNMGTVTLEFGLGTDLNEAMLLVSNKLNEIRRYPDNVDRPVIRASGSDSSPVIYMLVTMTGEAEYDIDQYRTYVDEEIIPLFERVDGVSDVFFYGGRPTEVQVTIVPDKLAAYNVTIDELADVLSSKNTNLSGDYMTVGRKNYRLRTVSEFTTVSEIEETVVFTEDGADVKVSDLASVAYGVKKADSAVREGTNRVMMVGVVKEAGANVLELTDNVEKVFNSVNSGAFKNLGLELKWVYDQRPYINGAIGLVKNNIYLGGVLAILALLLFLRSIHSTLIVATSIPISIFGTFVVLSLLGRTLNVISLAGVAFAVGMLIDNAIVVIENIDRHSKMGKPPMQAAYDGGVEVWGAIFASTMTTVSVFLPVVFVKQEAGQLFMDIAIAISCAVTFSLIVSLLVVPMLSSVLMERFPRRREFKISIILGSIGTAISNTIMRGSNWINKRVFTKVAVVVLLSTCSMVTVYLMFPKMEYLPQGNLNMVQSYFILPSGISLEERGELGEIFYEAVKPHIGAEVNGAPAIKNFFYSVYPSGMYATATAEDPNRAFELVPVLTQLMRSVPGTGGFTVQSGIFETRSGGGRSIDLIVSGEDLDELIVAASTIVDDIGKKIPELQVRPKPAIKMEYPEANFKPNFYHLSTMGLTNRSLGIAIEVYNDGRKVDEFKDPILGNIDLVIKAESDYSNNPEELLTKPLVLKDGSIVPISSVSTLEIGYGMESIRRYERKRTFTLTLSPPIDMVLETLMDSVEQDIITPLRDTGQLNDIEIRYSGSASSLTQARQAMQGNLIMALLITFLLMVALFDNFFYPLIILFTVPMALAGGFIGLKLVDTLILSQSFDVLTMLGFIILIGLVLNSAILIVHQSLNNINQYGMSKEEGISAAVESRLRPIAMSAVTSLFGMMPLVVFPGPGSELYRGLGSVVLGGLTLSTVFTVFMVPALLSLFMRDKKIEKIIK